VSTGRRSLPTPSGPGTSGSSGIPRSGPIGPGVRGSEPAPGRGPLNPAPARGANGITGGRPLSPSAGRPAGAIPRGNVIGGAPNQQQPPRGRGAVSGSPTARMTSSRGGNSAADREGASKGRVASTSNGILGGQPRPSRDRGRAGTTSRDVRSTSEAAEGPPPRGGGRPRGASASAAKREDRSTWNRRSDSREADKAEDRERPAEDKMNRPLSPPLPEGPDGDLGREG
jgi:hypothetical protein